MSVEEQTLNFIEEYRALRQLWDVNHKGYTNKVKRTDALLMLGEKFQMDVNAVKLKIKSLRSYFWKEHQKVQKSNEISSWFAYKPLLFIDPSAQKDGKENDQDCNNSTNYNDSHEGELVQEMQLESPNESEHISFPSNFPTEEREFVQTLRTKRNLKRNIRDEKEEDPLKFLKLETDDTNDKEEWKTFGNFIADNVRKLNPLNQILAKRHITNWLFDMQVKELGVSEILPP